MIEKKKPPRSQLPGCTRLLRIYIRRRYMPVSINPKSPELQAITHTHAIKKGGPGNAPKTRTRRERASFLRGAQLSLAAGNVVGDEVLGIRLDVLEGVPEGRLADAGVERDAELDGVVADARVG